MTADFSWWIESFMRMFLERDLPALGIQVPGPALRRFWTMLAHWHGQIWNSSEFARSFGVADTTVRRYLDLLTGALVVRQLPRLSHELSAAAPNPSASAAFRLVGLLDVLSSTPPVPSRRAPCPDGVSDPSRRKPVRKAGYTPGMRTSPNGR